VKVQPRTAPLSLSAYADDAIVGADVVAQALGISARQVLRLGIPVVNLGPRSKKFEIGDVRKFIASRKRDGSAV